MSMEQEHRAEWPQALRRYLGVSIVGNLVWEILQLPLYTLWTTGTRKQQAFAVVHCTVGDAMIAGLSLLVALALFARTTWPSAGVTRVYAAGLAFGVGYTIYSEWLNTGVRGSWAFSGPDAGCARDRDGSGTVDAVALGSDGRAVDRGWSTSLGRSTCRAGLSNERERATWHMSEAPGIDGGIDHLSRRGGTPSYLAHVVLVVPYLALMACPLMHLMHRVITITVPATPIQIRRSRLAVAPMDWNSWLQQSAELDH